jgi:transposase
MIRRVPRSSSQNAQPKLHRAGELTPVWVPDQAHEAVRDLVRARLAAVRSLRQARQQLSEFLLRHGHHYDRPAWTLLHRRWLADLRFEQPAHYLVLEDCIAAIEAATVRRDRHPQRAHTLRSHLQSMEQKSPDVSGAIRSIKCRD